MRNFKHNKIFQFIQKHQLVMLIFFTFLNFLVFHDLFFSYFESDEWYHFTYYLPLTRDPQGLLTAIGSTFLNNGALSGGQHVIPVASAIFFLNTLFFGLHYPPYAFMSLLVHSVNTFLVFLLMILLLARQQNIKQYIYALLSGIFFAISPSAMHAVTGAAPFYGQNTLSVTFFLLCLILFKQAFLSKQKKFLIFSIVFLFLALFTKETAAFLFILLPVIYFFEKKVFSWKYVTKLYIFVIVAYIVFRFVIPNIYNGNFVNKIVDHYLSSGVVNSVSDTETIVSQDTSIHENIYGELTFRSITFPIKMYGGLFFPRQTNHSILEAIAPLIYPSPSSGNDVDRSQGRLNFQNGIGNDLLLYVVSFGIIGICIYLLTTYKKEKREEERKAIVTGMSIIILSALPLVAIVLSFPRWGYDTYFDSRFYYNPNVGAALLFPFLLFAVAEFLAKVFKARVNIFVAIIFVAWLVNTMYQFNAFLTYTVRDVGIPRREVISQIQQYLPLLPKKIVFYIETDGGGPYGPVLPFQTSVPQALTVAYYDKSALPNNFFNKPLFDGSAQGYSFSEGRGFGYYTSKKDLAKKLLSAEFTTADIYAFYYDSKQRKISNRTIEVRKEMDDFLVTQKINADWEIYKDDSSNFAFRFPQGTVIEPANNDNSTTLIKSYYVTNEKFNLTLNLFTLPSFSINDYKEIRSNHSNSIESKKVVFDAYRYNDVLVFDEGGKKEYITKFSDKVLQAEVNSTDPEAISSVEKIIGSAEITIGQ